MFFFSNNQHFFKSTCQKLSYHTKPFNKEILQKYNPPSIVPKYADKVMSVMKDIGDEEITLDANA